MFPFEARSGVGFLLVLGLSLPFCPVSHVGHGTFARLSALT
ncbi:hypothetical protein FIU92_19760 (plasmid) [Ruegeria sp. THAF33]|nr:hypothetical protein FIU92_19760 [Ruegeria sp. THAF33]